MAQRWSSGETQTQIEICIKEEKHLSGGEEEQTPPPRARRTAAFNGAPHSKAGSFAIGGGKQGSANAGAKCFFTAAAVCSSQPPFPLHSCCFSPPFPQTGQKPAEDLGLTATTTLRSRLPATRGSAPCPPFRRNVGVSSRLKFSHASRSITDALPGAEFKCYEAQEESTSLPRRAATNTPPPPGGLS